MATTPYLLQRGSTWSWRRRVPEFSTKTRHWQLSLRTTDRSIACIIARRLNYECDRMLDAITDGKLTPAQAKAWLTSVVRSELDRIERQRMISRMDPVGSSVEDQRLDWATARAWSHLASKGLHPELSAQDRRTILNEGSNEADIASLETMLGVLSRDVLSETGVNKMLRAARDSIQTATGETLNPAAETILSLRQLLLAGKAAAWSASEGREDPSLEQARALAREILDGAPAENTVSGEPLHISGETTLIEAPTPPQVSAQRPEFSFDPDIVALVERINAEKDREHIKEDTTKQLSSQAHLFVKATGVTDVRGITQGHLKFYKSMLQRLPTSYGKSPKDADRTIEEILARAEDLPENKVGLSPRTINGHLDRFKLIFQFAKSESIPISDTIELGLLRVREEKRNRDKREAFTLPELQQVFRHIPKRGDAQAPGYRLERFIVIEGPKQPLGQPDIIRDHTGVTRPSCMEQGQPDLQGPKTPGVLHSIVEVVDDFLGEMVVGRVEREGLPKGYGVPNQDAAGFQRCVEPFVRIDGNGISSFHASKEPPVFRYRRGKTPVGAVDMKP